MFLNKSKKLFSHKLIGRIFLVLFLIMPQLVWAEVATNNIVFTEIMYDLAGSDDGHEWVEIYNAGGESVTVIDGSGNDSWRFNDGSNHIFTFVQGNFVLLPGGTAVLADDGATFLTDHPGFSGTLIDTAMSLNNTSDTLKLSADKGVTFFGDMTYQNTWGGNGDGKSLEKINLSGGNEQNNWRASIIDNGTPGIVATSPLDSTMSTATPSSSPSQSSPSSVSGSSAGNATSSPLLLLKAVAGNDILAEVNQSIILEAAASQGADNYKWYLGDGSVRQGQKITYSYQFPGTYLVTLEATHGQETSWDQLRVYIFGGRPIINEIMLDPNQGDSWLELYNQQDYAVDLSGWILTSNDKNFVVPDFVIMAKNSFLVLPKSLTGLDFAQSKAIALKYPNGSIIDQVNFNEIIKGVAAARNSSGFFWTGEPTPGSHNVVVSKDRKVNSQVNAAVLSVADKSENKLNNLIASSYSQVAFADAPEQILTADQSNFWSSLFSKFWLWLISVFGVALIISFMYLLIINKSR